MKKTLRHDLKWFFWMLKNIQNDLKFGLQDTFLWNFHGSKNRRLGAFCKDGIYSVHKKPDKESCRLGIYFMRQ